MPDPLKHEADAWLARAKDDLRAANKLMSGDTPFTAIASYHCQQAAEKALKGIIASSGTAIPKTHDLRLLVDRCSSLDASFESLRDACDELTPYATEFRYPTDIPDPTIHEIESVIALSSAILDAAMQSLSQRFPTIP